MNRIRRALSSVLCTAAILFVAIAADAQTTVTLPALKDNTLYEDQAGTISNGAGTHFFVGSAIGSLRRGLLAFDLSAIPAGAEITDATLTLNMDRTIAGREPISLHRAISDWGEAGSIAAGGGGGGGAGGPADVGDATWLHTFFPTDFWANPGGDFEVAASATTIVNSNGDYTWSDPLMVADIQGWVDDPLSDFGWVILGNETPGITAKRFQSREGTIPPELSVTFDLPIVAIPTLSDGALMLVVLLLTMAAIRRLRLA